MSLRERLQHPWLTLRCQMLLGALFLIAAWPKLVDPPAFAKAIHAYALVPAWALHPMALTLPWLEALSGALLCLGLWVRTATAWIAALLLVFITALGLNLAKGHAVDCGCFTQVAAPKTQQERLADMKWTILRDLGMLALAAQILVATRERESRRDGA